MMRVLCERQLQAMATAARSWKAANPGKVPVLVVRLPRNVWLAATIQSAIASGLVVVNQDAQDVIDAMLAVEPDPRRAPTLGMVRAALDAAGVAEWRTT